MAGSDVNDPQGKFDLSHILLFTAAMLLPAVLWFVVGWVSCLLPLLVFVWIVRHGWKHTTTQLMAAIPAAALAGVLLQSLELVLFSAILLPTGYAAAHSVRRDDKPWQAGVKCWGVLAGSLFVFFSILLAGSETSIFQAITNSLARGIDAALEQYSASEEIPTENLVAITETLSQIKSTVPLVLPGILASLLLMIVWLTLVLGNTALPAMGAPKPWKSYRYWTLPDQLIWALIVAGVLAAIPGQPLQLVGINFLMALTLLYAFQGLAITVFFLHKWKAPRFIRMVVYIVILLQSFGTIIIVAAGVADVWFDFRRVKSPRQNKPKNSE